MPVDNLLFRRVQRAYTTPGNAVAFSTPSRVAKHFNIKESVAREILEHLDGYTLHREYKQPKQYNPYYVHNRREQVQADLIDIGKIAASNDGIRFLLLLIDIMTKKIWVYALRRKTAMTMKRALSHWLLRLDEMPQKLRTDRGLEFSAGPVQQLLRSHNIEWQPAAGTLKACIAERVNKTLQILIYKYLTENETVRYLDVLPRLVKTYNSRGHRTLEGMSPDEADRPGNEARVQAIFHERYAKLAEQRREPRLKVGQVVRIKTEPKKISSSSRAYAEQFHGEYFSIMRINRTLPIPLYYLRSQDSGELIEDGFYANELQVVRGDVYKIETVLDRRRRRGRAEILVKWKYFGPQWNSWIPSTNVRRVY